MGTKRAVIKFIYRMDLVMACGIYRIASYRMLWYFINDQICAECVINEAHL